MARFMGSVQGHRGGASRLGTVKSGLSVSANGWHIGVKIHCFVNEQGKDEFQIYKTGGSNGGTLGLGPIKVIKEK